MIPVNAFIQRRTFAGSRYNKSKLSIRQSEKTNGRTAEYIFYDKSLKATNLGYLWEEWLQFILRQVSKASILYTAHSAVMNVLYWRFQCLFRIHPSKQSLQCLQKMFFFFCNAMVQTHNADYSIFNMFTVFDHWSAAFFPDSFRRSDRQRFGA